jgi:branched-chain amino acid transport system ATP-binding protein
MAQPLLSLKNVVVNYGGIRALKGISLEVHKGEIITLIGSNGAGKTTTLRAISGMLKLASGSVELNGENIAGVKPHLLVPKGLSHCPEGRGIFANLTVLENLEMGAYARTDKHNFAEDLEKVFKLFPRVKERLKQVAGTLSGGEQQMVAISRALMARPTALLLDEPSLGLAPQIVDTIFQIIQEVNNAGVTVLLVEQNAFLALKIAHRGYVIETGEIVLTGTGKDLISNPKVKEAYLGG